MSYKKYMPFLSIGLFIVIPVIIFSISLPYAGADQVGDVVCSTARDQQSPVVAFAVPDAALRAIHTHTQRRVILFFVASGKGVSA